MRITQWDILVFSRNANHKSPEFPRGYWPNTKAPASLKAWDPFVPMADGDGQTALREVLLAADDTAYHLGQFVLLRCMLGRVEIVKSSREGVARPRRPFSIQLTRHLRFRRRSVV
jgi:hypothetical protein